MTSAKHALLFFSHIFNEYTLGKFKSLKKAFEPYGDTFTIVYTAGKSVSAPDEFNPYITTRETLEELNYTWMHSDLMPGHANFPVMHFGSKHPDYATYTIIEYDVELTGAWEIFLAHLMAASADMVATHVATHSDQPQWHHWQSLDLSKSAELSSPNLQKLRFFGPLYRLSCEAMKSIDQEYKKGISGHYEALFPIILNAKGFSLIDLNELTHPNHHGRNRWYTKQRRDRKGMLKKSSMRFRPTRTAPGFRSNTLYHPIKNGNNSLIQAMLKRLFGLF